MMDGGEAIMCQLKLLSLCLARGTEKDRDKLHVLPRQHYFGF